MRVKPTRRGGRCHVCQVQRVKTRRCVRLLVCADPDCDVVLVRAPRQGRNPKWCDSHRRRPGGRDNLSRECSEVGCSRPTRARGLCSMHWKRVRAGEVGWPKQEWSDARKSRWHARRVVIEASAEIVTVEMIVARDGVACRGCGEMVDFSIEWPHPLSKSIDHVVPIACGGTHVLSNCQLMHLGCNSSKGARFVA